MTSCSDTSPVCPRWTRVEPRRPPKARCGPATSYLRFASAPEAGEGCSGSGHPLTKTVAAPCSCTVELRHLAGPLTSAYAVSTCCLRVTTSGFLGQPPDPNI